MNMKCLIIDDDPHCALLLEQYIETAAEAELLATIHDPLQAMEQITAKRMHPDIVFLDMELSPVNGTEIAQQLQNHALVIFTTSRPQLSTGAYRYNAVDYLLKPVRYEHFSEALKKAGRLLRPKPRSTHFFARESMGGKLVKVLFDDILYIQSAGNYAKILLCGERYYLMHVSLNKLKQFLPKQKFSRIHQSYIVNLDRVLALDGNMVYLSEDISLQMGATYRKDFLESLGAYMI